MKASDLSASIWNAIADLIRSETTKREIRFVKVYRRNTAKKHVWAREFGNVAIPLIGHSFVFDYYDTKADASVQKRQGKITVEMPKVGQLIAVLDPQGTGRFPVCLGIVLSKSGYWQGE